MIRRAVETDVEAIIEIGLHGSDCQRFVTRNTRICSMSSVGHCGDSAACDALRGADRARVCELL